MTATTRQVPAPLSATLVEPADLQLLAKQLDSVVARPVSGRLLRPLHEQLVDLAKVGRTHVNAVADRYVSLGVTPDGRSPDVASASPLDPVEAAPIGDLVVVEVDVRMLDLVARHIHGHIAGLGPGTQDVAMREHRPARIVVAVPVAAAETSDQLRAEVDEVVCAVTPRAFHAVGLWYEDFRQTSAEEVRALLTPVAAAA